MENHQWHHRPAHIFSPNTAYMVTGGTLHKEHFFRGDERLASLEQSLFETAEAYGWLLQAWAVFANHYHFIALAPDEAQTLKQMIQRLHSQTSREANRKDGTQGRQVWFQYWDNCLTYEKSYYARLNYVHNNAVKHGLVAAAHLYPYCSATWFHTYAEPAFRKKVESFGYSRVKVEDDF